MSGPQVALPVVGGIVAQNNFEAMMQGVVNRTLRGPGAEAVLQALPVAADRASKYLAFDGAGQPVALAGTINPTDVVVSTFGKTLVGTADAPTALALLGGASNVQQIAARADIPAATVPASVAFIRTAGYAAAGDGGAALYVRAASEPTHGGKVQSADGAWWELAENVPNVRMFGAGTGVASVDTAAFKAAAEYFGAMSASSFQTSNGGMLFIPDGVYFLVEEILFQNAGIRVSGESKEATKIYVTANLGSGKALLKFDQTNDEYSNVGCTVENLFIDMQGYTGHGIWWLKPYDGFNPTNLAVYGVHADYNAYRITADPGNTADPVSQTATITNLIGAHVVSTSATAAIFYAEALQEAVLINCKGFGSMQPVDLTETKADCHPFEFVDCRGITMLGCSSAFSKKHGIRIRTATRPSAGFFIYGHTYETIDGMLRADGNAVVGDVSQIDHGPARTEGAVSHPDGTFDLNRVLASKFDVGSRSINLDSACNQNTIISRDRTAITNNGARTTIIGQDSDASPGAVLRATQALLASANGGIVNVEDGQTTITASAAQVGRLQFPFASNSTGLLIAVNRGGTTTLSSVNIGAAGTGPGGIGRALWVAD